MVVSQVWERLEFFEPRPKMLTLPAHSTNAHGFRSERTLDYFSISGVDRNYPFGRRGLGVIIDVLRRREITPNLMKAIRQIGLPERLSKGIRIAEQQSFVFVQREIWNQAYIGTEIRNQAANIILDGALDPFDLLDVGEMRGQRSAWKALSQGIEVDHG